MKPSIQIDTLFKSAVGLSFDPKKEDAPTISVKGQNYSADQIVKIAQRFAIPVVENPSLAKTLSKLDIDSSIPESLFESVAILLKALDPALAVKKSR
ncbi:MAG: EscU/YscU/HrcU family type III secretion system export apparatus switch protein [bacterium]|nr:EscU/YscU/HrcU family type III secretion system export apparatus switch protein [bacterium]